jgi:hypothetical protein
MSVAQALRRLSIPSSFALRSVAQAEKGSGPAGPLHSLAMELRATARVIELAYPQAQMSMADLHAWGCSLRQLRRTRAMLSQGHGGGHEGASPAGDTEAAGGGLLCGVGGRLAASTDTLKSKVTLPPPTDGRAAGTQQGRRRGRYPGAAAVVMGQGAEVPGGTGTVQYQGVAGRGRRHSDGAPPSPVRGDPNDSHSQLQLQLAAMQGGATSSIAVNAVKAVVSLPHPPPPRGGPSSRRHARHHIASSHHHGRGRRGSDGGALCLPSAPPPSALPSAPPPSALPSVQPCCNESHGSPYVPSQSGSYGASPSLLLAQLDGAALEGGDSYGA